MKEEKDILERVNHRDGMTVPKDYFADFAAHMADSLAPTPFETNSPVSFKPRTLWQRVRPYVYMAAMFGGVWCMLKMFTNLTSTDSTMPPALADALGNEVFVNEYILDNIDQYDIVDSLYENGIEIDELSLELSDEEAAVDDDQYGMQ